jgi:hypothetical protein
LVFAINRVNDELNPISDPSRYLKVEQSDIDNLWYNYKINTLYDGLVRLIDAWLNILSDILMSEVNNEAVTN